MSRFKVFVLIAILAFFACDATAKKSLSHGEKVNKREHSGRHAAHTATGAADAPVDTTVPTEVTSPAPTSTAEAPASTDTSMTTDAPVTTTDAPATTDAATTTAAPAETTVTSASATVTSVVSSNDATASSGSSTEWVTPDIFVCTPRPEVVDLEAVCWNVQDWINKNRYAQGCQADVHQLSVAKDLMKETDACFLDWPTPAHLAEHFSAEQPANPAMSLEKNSITSATSKRLSKVKHTDSKAHSKAIRMLRDQFITRIEDVLLCDIPASEYCAIAVSHGCTPNCDSDSGVVPAGMVVAGTTGHIQGAVAAVVCEAITDKATCNTNVADCIWLFETCTTRFEVVSPCSQIIDCDECRADDSCFWDKATESCGPMNTPVQTV